MKQEIQNRFNLNISRVRNLIRIYAQLVSGKGRKGHQNTDTLRAATVLLHASIEDVLRSLAYWKLPLTTDANILSSIQLSGTTGKINLGSLISFRGMTVDSVISQSVNDMLERSNYNNTNEVVGLINSVGLNASLVSSQLGIIDEIMKRRHQIVHRADANPSSGIGQHKVSSISKSTVEAWTLTTEHFVNTLLAQV